jgi:hypothetical protein
VQPLATLEHLMRNRMQGIRALQLALRSERLIWLGSHRSGVEHKYVHPASREIRSYVCWAPTVSAITARRTPSGFSAPIVESRAV